MKKSYIVFAVMLGVGMFFSACGNKKTGGADTKTENTETIEEDLKMDDFVIEVVSVQANDPSLTARVVLKIQENEKCPSDLQRIENIWLDIGGVRQKEPEAYECLKRAKTYADYGFTLTTDPLQTNGLPVRNGIRFYYDENDRVIMIQYYEEYSSNSVK